MKRFEQSDDYIILRGYVFTDHMEISKQSPFTDVGEKERHLEKYLEDRTRNGDRYFKSRYIAREIPLSPKEVGASMAKLRESATTLDVKKWTHTSPATWYVRPVERSR